MRVLIFGRIGQLGTELTRLDWPAAFQLILPSQDEADFTDPAKVAAALDSAGADLVINASAYTAVDKAETEEEIARAINATAPGQIARFCGERGIPMIHVSTDYVFDGSKSSPYVETDPVAPLGAYGRTKEEGERLVREGVGEHVILRTAWVYAAHGHNFVRTMLRLGADRDALSIVDDQKGCPTTASSLAAAIGVIAGRIADAGGDRAGLPWGTYHFTGGGDTTWYGFASAIFELAGDRLGRRPALTPITTDQYPTPAARPANSVLDCSLIGQKWGITPEPWRQGLIRVVDALLSEQEGAKP